MTRERCREVISIHRNILLISDADDAQLVRDALVNSGDGPFKVDWVRSRADAIKRLNGKAHKPPGSGGPVRGAPTAVLVDLFLPDSSGLDTFAHLTQTAPHVPILILSDAEHEEVARQAVRQGAQDYFLKAHLDPHLLPKALRTIIERGECVEALYEEQERARVTLDSISDAVISADLQGRVTHLNGVAEKMTGWKRGEAAGRPLDEVFRAVDSAAAKDVCNAMELAIRENSPAALRCDSRPAGPESDLREEDSAAPIHNRHGEVTGAVIVLRDTSSTQVLSHRMSYLAQHDSLTDLPNRVLLHDRLNHAISLCHRRRRKMAVLFLDIDRFKHVNDSLGHEIGDRLLRSVAQRLLGCVRRSDTVSRQGGDEFVILLSEVGKSQDAAVSAEKMLQALSAPHRLSGHEIRVTASIGIVVYPDDGTDAEVLLKHADVAMYHAKDQGRANYQFFEADLNVRVLERQVLESDLRRALDGHELMLCYQPRMNLQTGRIVGAEAFIRWRHPERGLILPPQFVPIAEACGAIVPIGRWVVKESCRQAMAWRDAGLGPVRISINVSSAELRDRELVSCIRDTLAATGLAPSELELELREDLLTQDAQLALDVLHELKQLDVLLALDDFGTGCSSLSHLRQFPIDVLKIDESFVHELTTDSDVTGIVSAVIGMGRNLGMQVVAEGVESQQQLACLQQLACPQAQGFYLAEPLSPAEFIRRCRRDGARSPEEFAAV